MAANDLEIVDDANRAHTHVGAGAETVLTIPTTNDKHFSCDLLVRVQGDGGPAQRQLFARTLMIQNDGGTVVADLSTDTSRDLDPNTTGYALSATVSGSNVLVQVAAAAAARSGARASGFKLEHAITGA